MVGVVGLPDGTAVGFVGLTVGESEGSLVGDGDGCDVGANVGVTLQPLRYSPPS